MPKTQLKSFSASLFPDEADCLQELLTELRWDEARAGRVSALAAALVKTVRKQPEQMGMLENFLQHYALTSQEGQALMLLAEALLRIPDAATVNDLIADKVGAADWSKVGKASGNPLIKAAELGLKATQKTLGSALGGLGKPVIREAMIKAMHMLGREFVLGEDIQQAFIAAAPFEKGGYRLSYDMLGEGARTQDDADLYFKSYRDAIRMIGQRLLTVTGCRHDVRQVPGVSVKLSALHPRYTVSQRERCLPEIAERLEVLAKEAATYNIALTVDAEETERLALSLEIFEAVLKSKAISAEWKGLGLAVQAYQKRAPAVVDWVIAKAHEYGRPLQVRLVKGAYWDREIKRAQELGLPDYPVYTRKHHCDVSYLACAAQLLQQGDMIYPMFGTHNAHTIAAILDMAQEYGAAFEFQKLYGMGDSVYAAVLADYDVPVTLYAPVGTYKELLPYLVRRILENGANSSFVNKLLDEGCPAESLVADPVEKTREYGLAPHPAIAMPRDLYQREPAGARVNSYGLDLQDEAVIAALYQRIEPLRGREYEAPCLVGGKAYKDGRQSVIVNPARKGERVGKAWYAREDVIVKAFDTAAAAFEGWSAVDVQEKARIFERYAALLEDHSATVLSLLVREAGKTLPDAQSELREAIDFCRYYANQARIDFNSAGYVLSGPVGESNLYYRHGRGVFVCISPWNFPLAIFTGQIAAALLAGNSVVAKPAEQTPLIAAYAVGLMYEAGVPKDVLHLVIGDGFTGATLINQEIVAGVAFTGSVDVAREINQTLATKRNGIVPLIAETGGQNAMIVDSSALPEQVVDHVIQSAFNAAGQRCSALRVLCIQDDIADMVLRVLSGAMQQLSLGDPALLRHDIGPIIDEGARSSLLQYCNRLAGYGRLVGVAPLPDGLEAEGFFMAPRAFEIDSLSALKDEVFGPVLHIYRYKKKDLDFVIEQLNGMGYGLTLGIESRVDNFINMISQKVRAGNVYVNRGMIGAVVGSQPFGGHGLSGTGPKAGGPDYLRRFGVETVVSTDTTATGGNASLVSLGE